MNSKDNNTKSAVLERDVLIGAIVFFTKLGYVLSDTFERKRNQSNKPVNIIHSHAMPILCGRKPN